MGKQKTVTIDEVQEGDLVYVDDGTYCATAIVTKCFHGNLFYANYFDDDIDIEELPHAIDGMEDLLSGYNCGCA